MLRLLPLLLVLVPAHPALAQTGEFPTIPVEGSVSGRLSADGPALRNRGPFVAYRVEGLAGERFQADLRSSDFDAYLTLARLVGGVTDLLAEDDDGGEGTDARLRFTLPEEGSYLLLVQSFGTGTGAYSLSLTRRPEAPRAEPRPLTLGVPGEGRLSEASSVLVTDWFEEIPYDLWTFQGEGGTNLLISLASPDFDAYLEFGPLSGGDLQVTHTDDDGGPGTDSLLRLTLPHDGTFGIRARPLGGNSPGGGYVVLVDPWVQAPPLRRSLEVGDRVEGELTLEDAVLDGSIPFQEWTVEGRAGQTVRIRLRSDAFDAFLSVGREEGDGTFVALAENDDAPDDGLNSLVELRFPEDGTYVIRARPLSAGGLGAYSLEVEAGPSGD